jgi:hypothetical protein
VDEDGYREPRYENRNRNGLDRLTGFDALIDTVNVVKTILGIYGFHIFELSGLVDCLVLSLVSVLRWGKIYLFA